MLSTANSELSTALTPFEGYVVGIGASAGGLEALQQVLPGLPGRADMCYVVLQHLAPTHRSLMADILSRQTALVVREIQDGTALAPGCLFVCPPNAHVEYDGSRLRLTVPDPQSLPRPSINLFFASLADTAGPQAVGVVLSGTGSDGAIGLRRILAEGGRVLVQAPRTAKYSGMPEAALDSVGADLSRTPEGIGAALADLPSAGSGPTDLGAAAANADSFQGLFALLRRHGGIDFELYKEATLMRRISRRMQARSVDTPADYLHLCESDAAELDQLTRDALISVTTFWRDSEAFSALAEHVREQLKARDTDSPLRIWVAGCATGEEAYSLAMVYAEALEGHAASDTFQIFATDLDMEALAIARRGVYPASAVAGLPALLRARHFKPVSAQFEFSRRLRERVVFSRQDVTRDPPLPRMDLISCRNLLIYLKPDAQSRVMAAFHYALKPQGLLFLGRSESVLHHEALFAPVKHVDRLYERRPGPAQLATLTSSLPNAAAGSVGRRAPTADAESQLLRLAADHYLPPCVLLDDRLQVLHIHGDVGPFLGLQPGAQTFDLMSLARPEVAAQLRALCALPLDASEPTHTELLISTGRSRQAWRAVLHPFQRGHRHQALLAFLKRQRTRPTPSAAQASTEVNPAAALVGSGDASEQLRALVSQLETNAEEMQALNEEAQATNEELQASNEELEAANEELQATNQELATVNAELNHHWRLHQLLTDELQAIQNCIDLPLLVVDEHLAITRFNDAAARIFLLSPGCEGLHISTVRRPRGMPDFTGALHQAMVSASTVSVPLPPTDDGREYVLHVAHKVTGGVRRGMVITLTDNTDVARDERAQQRTDHHLDRAVQAGALMLAVKDASGRYLFANPAYCRFLEVEADTLLGRTDALSLPPALAQPLRAGDLQALNERPVPPRDETLSVQGQDKAWHVHRTPLHDADGTLAGVTVQAMDITARQRTDQGAHTAAAAFEHCGQAQIVTDAEYRIVKVNPAFTRITGYSAEEAIGKTPQMLASPRHDAAFFENLWRQVGDAGMWEGEIWNRRKAGDEFPEWLTLAALRDAQGQVSHYTGVFSDITVLAREQEQAAQLATHDPLTKLPNRRLLLDRLKHALQAAERGHSEVAVVFLDLDNFKHVNDSLGHEAGDDMLCTAARRISESVRAADTVARLGGDEFVVVLENTSRHECLQTVERISRSLSQTFTLQDTVLTTAASIGITLYPSDGKDSNALMRNADAAMYRAKRSGRGRYVFFSSEVGESARNRLTVESELRKAVTNRELRLHYQPQVDAQTGALLGVEALLRWPTADGNWVAPSLFLPIAEETSLIEEIGDWVLDAACAQLAQWRAAGLHELMVSVNVAPRQLRDRSFADKLQGHLMHHRIPGDRLVLEITEGALMQQREHLEPLLQQLRRLNVQLSLDDFGTGYSSLARLRQLPLTELKIDRSFIDGVVDQRDDREIVTAIMAMAHALGLRVVAEGVETEAQADCLRGFHCPPVVQGYHVARPMPPDQLLQWQQSQPQMAG
ncbi:EAL domain-containing protein [Roseateles sp. BYS87W]|uniref:protein-glutamate O-methyltransferase n=1 Tax=Pelomonas baiyunensis TaxID=3299026 RepID=A0ABW7GU84_9BURK